MKITIETAVQAPLQRVWEAWNSPDDIRQWNAASPDWHTPASSVDLREVRVEFHEEPGRVRVRETFDAETRNPPEMQRGGWQAILDNFPRYVEGGRS